MTSREETDPVVFSESARTPDPSPLDQSSSRGRHQQRTGQQATTSSTGESSQAAPGIPHQNPYLQTRYPGSLHSSVPGPSRVQYQEHVFHGQPVHYIPQVAYSPTSYPQNPSNPGVPVGQASFQMLQNYPTLETRDLQGNLVYQHGAAPPQGQWYNSGPYYHYPQQNYGWSQAQQVPGWPSQNERYAFHHVQLQAGAFQRPQSMRSIDQKFENLDLDGDPRAQHARPADLRPKVRPRGPPRRPKQSGPALWVGNLPPKTTILELKEHFSQGRKSEIESVRLLSKTSCAFVNYRTHETCISAMDEFHDSSFGGSKLSCKIAENMTDKAGDRGSKIWMNPDQSAPSSPVEYHEPDLQRSPTQESKATPERSTRRPSVGSKSTSNLPDRYFILKSLTLQDVEASTRSGLWATQAHNEEILNQAYQLATNVYLIFSVNKSGEYFGVARMASSIPASGFTLKDDASSERAADGLRSSHPSAHDASAGASLATDAVITPETEHAPRGQLYEEPERGIVFWEAKPDPQALTGYDASTSEKAAAEEEIDDSTRAEVKTLQLEVSATTKETLTEEDQDVASPTDEVSLEQPVSVGSVTAESPTMAPGNFFRLEWIVVRRVPFFKCRGLRNAWNDNKKVKVARDGTELETTVGKRLLDLFQRLPGQ